MVISDDVVARPMPDTDPDGVVCQGQLIVGDVVVPGLRNGESIPLTVEAVMSDCIVMRAFKGNGSGCPVRSCAGDGVVCYGIAEGVG